MTPSASRPRSQVDEAVRVAPVDTRQSLRRRRSPLIWWFAGALLALATMELAIRQFYYVPLDIDPIFSYPVVKADTTAVYRREGSGTSRWTAHGVRRPGLPAADARPILVLGDSFTEAFMIDDRDVFTHRLEAALTASLRAVPVLNIGRSGASAADYVGYAPLYERVFHPAWIVIQLTDDDLEADAWVADKAHFVAASDGTLQAAIPEPARHGRPWGAFWWLRQHLAILHFGIVRFHEFRQAARAGMPLFGHGSAPPPATNPRLSYPVEDVLDTMAGAYQRRVTFLYLPAFDRSHPLTPATETEKRFLRACETNEWSCVSIRARYREFADAATSPFGFSNSAYNKGHLNRSGHAAAAEELSAEIRRLVSRGVL